MFLAQKTVIKISIFPKLNHIFNIIPDKIPTDFLLTFKILFCRQGNSYLYGNSQNLELPEQF